MRLRTRRHDFELPTIKYEFNKRNFIVRLVAFQLCVMPYGIGQAIIFSSCGFFLSIFCLFSRLISAAAHWMSTILRHMMWS